MCMDGNNQECCVDLSVPLVGLVSLDLSIGENTENQEFGRCVFGYRHSACMM